MSILTLRLLILLCCLSLFFVVSAAVELPRHRLSGDVAAAYDLLERVLPGSSSHFSLSFLQNVTEAQFRVFDLPATFQVGIAATSASEMTAGLGWYLREVCNLTYGWPRGGGSNMFLPNPWPKVGAVETAPVTRLRVVPWSYFMNVCTHSYSFVWYDWHHWEALIDWMALSGINLVLAMTGQEEVQYKVLQQFGLDDETIRTWFNGPAFLTWSRGQNEYGSNIAGPLPRSFMKSQWHLQRKILARYRSLGIVGQLPGFQGNVPWKLASILGDHNMTQQGDTAWMYSTDPLFSKIADVWMKTLITDFGTDHWYQLDGYFDGGTAPWYFDSNTQQQQQQQQKTTSRHRRSSENGGAASSTPCRWSSSMPNTYLAGCDKGCQNYPTIAAAQAACAADDNCGGITFAPGGNPQLRMGSIPQPSPINETSFAILNVNECHATDPYPQWVERGAAAYAGLSRTDPEAIWSFQGWAIVGWDSEAQGRSFKGFVDAVPHGKFVVIDMSTNGVGEWRQWNDASFFGAPFIWTSLHDFGGTDGMKGDLSRANEIPFAGLGGKSTAIGTGFTPEGIDQNPVYYDFLTSQNFRAEPVANITHESIVRAHRRYGLKNHSDERVSAAWALLVNSSYAHDLSVQDRTGIPHLPGTFSEFLPNGFTPSSNLCSIFKAWGLLLDAASSTEDANGSTEPLRYDVVNLGREVLAQLSVPISQNFSWALLSNPLNAADLLRTGGEYLSLLSDVDQLVATDQAFLLGSWIEMARDLAANATDCGPNITCADFMEWNARCQLTTWNPVPADAQSVPAGPVDYAGKHWSGLIKDYYHTRAAALLQLAVTYAGEGKPLNMTVGGELVAQLAYSWQHATKKYPSSPVGSFVNVSYFMYNKYAPAFSACGL